MLLVPGGEAAAQHVRSVFSIAPNSRAIDLYVVSLTWCLVKEQQLSLLFMCSVHRVPGGGAAAQHVPALRQTGDLWHSPAHDAAVVRACRVQAWERKKPSSQHVESMGAGPALLHLRTPRSLAGRRTPRPASTEAENTLEKASSRAVHSAATRVSRCV
ncbi:hypothetical protein NDU88_003375 [Pleurodeles waltl]|uniref:Uncharacterized protein n=1 Tax=Pleurodeles waltl TaxID=8319 RepID=A0AAV7Q8U7_PLEWA|nr:hypothetical protein NDU88_003375 [Pleurodeles waltl]